MGNWSHSFVQWTVFDQMVGSISNFDWNTFTKLRPLEYFPLYRCLIKTNSINATIWTPFTVSTYSLKKRRLWCIHSTCITCWAHNEVPTISALACKHSPKCRWLCIHFAAMVANLPLFSGTSRCTCYRNSWPLQDRQTTGHGAREGAHPSRANTARSAAACCSRPLHIASFKAALRAWRWFSLHPLPGAAAGPSTYSRFKTPFTSAPTATPFAYTKPLASGGITEPLESHGTSRKLEVPGQGISGVGRTLVFFSEQELLLEGLLRCFLLFLLNCLGIGVARKKSVFFC